jgi:hypothetical protein
MVNAVRAAILVLDPALHGRLAQQDIEAAKHRTFP